MMKRLIDPRTLMLAAGTAAFSLSAEASELRGTVTYEDGRTLPAGEVEIILQQQGGADGAAEAKPLSGRIPSDGSLPALNFVLALPDAAAGAGTQIVARLLRGDGWLLARGSAEITPGQPVEITLYTVMY